MFTLVVVELFYNNNTYHHRIEREL
eukprot:UN09632